MPSLTEERRRDLIKVIKHEGEMPRSRWRNARRDANHALKELLKGKSVSEDEERRRRRRSRTHRQTHRRYRQMIAAKKPS